MNMKALILPSIFPFPPSISFDSRRRGFPGTRATVGRKRANLFARKNKRAKLPDYGDDHGRLLSISEFLHHPSSVKALFNTRALEGFESLGSSTYRCFLQKIRLLMLEVAPVLELRVIPTREDCTVEMLSCRFEGSEYMKRQNDLFSGSCKGFWTDMSHCLLSSCYKIMPNGLISSSTSFLSLHAAKLLQASFFLFLLQRLSEIGRLHSINKFQFTKMKLWS